MPRTNDDSWDLKSSVGATATMVAAARAVASRQPDPIVNDPFAAVLVRAVGIKLFTRIVDGLLDFGEIGAGFFPACFGIRGATIDDFVSGACREGIRQLVILASGLDCRAYRLQWPAAMEIYEVDQPAVMHWKTDVLSSLGCVSAARHRCVGIDLRDDWPTALQQAGFDATKPTAWIAEGLLIGYLPQAVHDEILQTITTLSVEGSRIIADHFDIERPNVLGEVLNYLHQTWKAHDPEVNLHSLTFSETRRDPGVYLAEHGWAVHDTDIVALLTTAGRFAPEVMEFPYDPSLWHILQGIRS
jgi:methyltransferase (TIGR00027 family)